MTLWDAPNQQVVRPDGSAPWDEGTGGVEGEVTPQIALPDESGTFDPGEHTVAEVEDYVAEHPEERARIAAAEESGKGRTTLLDFLSGS